MNSSLDAPLNGLSSAYLILIMRFLYQRILVVDSEHFFASCESCKRRIEKRIVPFDSPGQNTLGRGSGIDLASRMLRKLTLEF
jgi:hypothetical protein